MKINNIFNFLFNIKYNYRENSSELFRYAPNKIFVFLVLLINFSTWLIAVYIDRQINYEQIALHYNVDFGINLMGSVKQIYIVPFLGLIIFLINFLLLININQERERRFTAQVIFIASLLCNLTLLASIGAIYLINFR